MFFSFPNVYPGHLLTVCMCMCVCMYVCAHVFISIKSARNLRWSQKHLLCEHVSSSSVLPVCCGGLSSFNCPSTKTALENTNYILFYFPTTKTALAQNGSDMVLGKVMGRCRFKLRSLEFSEGIGSKNVYDVNCNKYSI